MQSKLLITIDTEVRIRNRDLPDAFEVDVLGEVGNKAYGTYWVAEQLSQHGLAGTFFLDVYGSQKFGEWRYREMCDRLLSGGHSVQLHTHPDQAYDLNRRHMHEYSLADQEAIVRDGLTLLKAWTSEHPIAHRAGRYGANTDTLRALQSNNIYADSSFFYRRADCQLPFGRSNAPSTLEGVWEIPVTVVPEPVTKRGHRLPNWTRHFWRDYQKLDVNCMEAGQLCDSVLEVHGRIPYIVTFLHSFSFVRRESSGVLPDQAALAAFQALLKLVTEKQIPVITFEQVATELGQPEANELKVETL